MKMKKYILIFFLISIFVILKKSDFVFASEPKVIVLDPGHGGEEKGAWYYGIEEKDINLKVAKYVKQELEQYEGILVYLTREDDEDVGLYDRAMRAKEMNADILISLHFNASISHRQRGASIYVSTDKEYRNQTIYLADFLLGEFEALGLPNVGTFARVTEAGMVRPTGDFEDYYGIIRHAYLCGFPGVLVEHCYMDNEEDREFMKTDEGLRQLAKADALGIAAYFGLKKNGTIYKGKHAKVFGATTKGIMAADYASPEIKSIRLISCAGTTPGIIKYEVEVEEHTSVTSIRFIYQNEAGKRMTISGILKQPMETGTHEVWGKIPKDLEYGKYRLVFVGAYDASGYDAAYNRLGYTMSGFGKCDTINSFRYDGECDFVIDGEAEDVTVTYYIREYKGKCGCRY